MRGHGTPKRRTTAMRTPAEIAADHRAAVERARAAGWPDDPRFYGVALQALGVWPTYAYQAAA